MEERRARAFCFPASLTSKKKYATCADPIVEVHSISWIIEALVMFNNMQ
jgi:hypothetical protein